MKVKKRYLSLDVFRGAAVCLMILVTTGMATALISFMIYFIEIKGKKGYGTRFFEVFGKNPLFIFALSSFLPKTTRLIPLGDGVTPWNFLYKNVFLHATGNRIVSVCTLRHSVYVDDHVVDGPEKDLY